MNLQQHPSTCIKVVLYGPESTGKTTLARQLAAHYHTLWVPEFARDYLQKKYDDAGIICEESDLLPIAEGQMAWENKAAQQAHQVLFCDTNMLQTYYYGKAYYKNYHNKQLKKAALEATYDLYFLTYIDVPWEEDVLRDKPHERVQMYQLFKHSLEENGIKFEVLKGSEKERLQKAIDVIDRTLKGAMKNEPSI